MKSIYPTLALAGILGIFGTWSAGRTSGEEADGGEAAGREAAAEPTATRSPGDRSRLGETPDPDVLNRAIEALATRSSVSARLRQRVDMFDRQLIGSGQYFQSGAGNDQRLRLEIKLQLDENRLATFQQVNDGSWLWTYQYTANGQVLSRVDLRRLAGALAKAKTQAKGDASVVNLGELALGGLPRLLVGLRENFQVANVEEGLLGDTRALAVELQWKPERLAAMLPSPAEGGTPDPAARLAAATQLPDRAMLYLDSKTLFPSRIEFRRVGGDKKPSSDDGRGAADRANSANTPRAENSGPNGTIRGGKAGEVSWKTLVSVDFSDVILDQPIDERQFQYSPGSQPVLDTTQAAIDARVAR